MKKRSVVLLALLICAVFGLPLAVNKIIEKNSVASDRQEYSYKSFQIDKDKWGYVISHFDKQFIKQIYIPAVGGKICFKTEADADKTAKLVIVKLNRKEMPSLTRDELEKLGVIP
jgi:hypothetical protein